MPVHARAVATPKGVELTLSGFDETSGTALGLDYRTLTAPRATALAISSSAGAEYALELESPCDAALEASQSSPLAAGGER